MTKNFSKVEYAYETFSTSQVPKNKLFSDTKYLNTKLISSEVDKMKNAFRLLILIIL